MRLATVAWIAIAAAAPAAGAERLEARPADGSIAVNVYRSGVFSRFAHDHHFVVTEWRAVAEMAGRDPASASVTVILSARSLRDTQPRLSDGDRQKVDAQAAGPDVLDAAHHPQIELRSGRIELPPSPAGGSVRGTLHGTLTLRGRSAPVDVPFEAERAGEGWRVRGTARVKQSTFGITPFSGFGGTVRVKDEMGVELAFTLRPLRDGPRAP